MQNNSSLLPNGLKDLLPPEAEKEAHIINILMQEFSKFGYSRVKPPMVEFEDSLLADGPGATLARNTFRLMDPVSQKMMGVRADTTAQITRIVSSRMADELRPLRISYAADVLKVNGTQLRPERQFCQVGCEMVGGDEEQDEVEICLTALNSLSAIGITNISIDLTIPALVDDLYSAYNIEQTLQDELNKLLSKRDRDGIKDIKSDVVPLLLFLLDASGVASDAFENLKKIDSPQSMQNNILKLHAVYEGLVDALAAYDIQDINITVDLIERRGFDYQNGISFTLFSTDSRGELGRGGRYKTLNTQDETASGFTLYMDSLLHASPIVIDQSKKAVPSDTAWADIKKLQDDGHKISRQK